MNTEWLSLRDFPAIPPVEENQASFAGNALKKAQELSRHAGVPSLSDDSGLEVDALDGAPGLLSARFSGQGDRANNELLLQKLSGVLESGRSARFRCAVAYVAPGESPLVLEGSVEGVILTSPRGEAGFGYDPLFLPTGYDRSFAELSGDEKNKISHRARALAKLCLNWTERYGSGFARRKL